MSALGIIALAAAVVWVAMLSFVVLLLVRQIGLITARMDAAGGESSAADQGLIIGESVPKEAVEAVPEVREDLMYLLVLSDSCEPCVELVSDLDRIPDEALLVALVKGNGSAKLFEDQLRRRARTIRDPTASNIAQGLEVEMTPFAMQIERGNVTGKAVLGYGVGDLLELIESRARPDSTASDFAGTLEVIDGHR